jgi:hypothetical protein
MSKPIRLSTEEYNRLCNIEHNARDIYDFIENNLKPAWGPRTDPVADKAFSRGLYCHINMKRLLNK